MKKILFIFIFTFLTVQLYAGQSIISDPSAGSCTDPAPANHGTGTCSLSNITGYARTETFTFTATTGGPTATFSVVGSVSGSLSNTTSGAAHTISTSSGLPLFVLTLGDGGIAYNAGDNFQVTISSGTALNKSTFDLLTLSQVCSNGCTSSTAFSGTSGTFSSNLTVNGNSTFGDATSDTITATARFASDLVPSATNTYGLGSSSFKWSSLFLGSGIIGITDGSSAGSGYVGQVIRSQVTSQNAGTSGVWTNLTSISLTAGDWDVTGIASMDNNGAAITNATAYVAVSINSGATTTDQVAGDNQVGFGTGTTGNPRGNSIPVYQINVSGTTTVYLKTMLAYTTATPLWNGRLAARRVR